VVLDQGLETDQSLLVEQFDARVAFIAQAPVLGPALGGAGDD
jgi:hypothetical protein